MSKLTYTNEGGQSIVLANTRPLLVTKIDGLGSVQNNIQRQKAPYQDGSTITGRTLSEREIVIEGAIIPPCDILAYRAELLRVFNPKMSGVLKYEKSSIVKEIECVPELAPVFPSDFSKNYQVFMITLLCPNPFFVDLETESEEMADWVGGLKFPLRIPTIFASRSAQQNKVVYNAGDVETPITFEFTGPCTNPRVSKVDTGDFIKVNRELTASQRLIITTDFGNKTVTLKDDATGEETNAFNYIDLGSTFFQLEPGDNAINYDAESGLNSAKVFVKWRNRFLGV